MSDGMGSDFVTFAMQLLHGRIVGVLVWDEEGGLNRTPVGIVATFLEQTTVDVNVVVVDGIVEWDHHHLRNIGRLQLARNLSAVRRTEAVGQHTLTLVARRGTVRVLVDCAHVFIRSIVTVGNSVAEQFLVHTLFDSAWQLSLRTDGFIGGQFRKSQTRSCTGEENEID